MKRVGGILRALRRRLGPFRVPLRQVASTTITSNQPDAGAAVRWIDAVIVDGTSRAALLCHPDSSIGCTMDVPCGASLVTWCALQPESWPANRGGVRFTATVESGGRRASRSIVLDPGRLPADRHWKRLRVPFPRDTSSPTVVTLATALPEGASPASAWAVWGDPHVSWPRPLRATAASAAGAIRMLGVRGALRRLQQVASRPESSSSYREWVARHSLDADGLACLEREVAALPAQPLITVLLPVFNTPAIWLSRAVESVRRQVYPRWHLSICDDGSTDEGTRAALGGLAQDGRITVARLESNQGISAASNAALANARGDWIALLDHDDELAPDALAEIVRAINLVPDAGVIYSDEDKLDAAGERCDPFFKPDWAPEHLLSCMYTCHLFAARKALVEDAGGFRVGFEGSQDYDLMLRLIDRTPRIVHIPKVLYHWRKSPASAAGSVLAKPWAIDAGRRALGDFVRRNRLDADVLADAAPGRYRVRRRVTANASVSVIVGAFAPLTSSGDAARLVAELEQRGYVSEITVMLSRDGDAHQLPGLRNARVVVAPSGHHALAEVNRLARGANGRHLLFIAPGLSPMTPEWMEALIEHSSVSDVAAVGAKLLDPEGRIRHIGLVMGLRGIAGSPFAGFPGTVEGYVSNAMGMRNYSAVSGACLMTRRDVFEALDGFDLRAGPIHAAVDYCLRARRGGRRIVFTPYACLRETGSSPAVEDPVGDAYMREAWADVIRDDPFYNPNLSRDFFDCRPRA